MRRCCILPVVSLSGTKPYWDRLLVCFFFSISVSQASVVVGGTRVIFDGTKKTTTVSVQNKDNVTNIVQSWLAIVDETSPAKDSFITTPPLFRLKAGEKGFVRILRTGKPMPEDRESMLWLNIKEGANKFLI